MDNKGSIKDIYELFMHEYEHDGFYIVYDEEDNHGKTPTLDGKEMVKDHHYKYSNCYQGDIYKSGDEDGLLLLINQTCDLENGKHQNVVMMKMEKLSDMNRKTQEKIYRKMIHPNKGVGNQYVINFDPDMKQSFVLPRGGAGIITDHYICDFTGLCSFEKGKFESMISEGVLVKKCTVVTPYIEKIMCKFGYCYSRPALRTDIIEIT